MKLSILSAVLTLPLITTTAAADPSIGYRQVQDIFDEHCLNCHSRGRAAAGLDLSTFETTLDGSESGAVLVAGDPEDSYLYAVTAHLEEPAMPPGGEPIPDADLLVLRQWIEGGLREQGVGPVDPTPPPVMSAEALLPEARAASFSEATRSGAMSASPTGRFRSPVVALAANETAGLIAVGHQGRVLLHEARGGQPIREFAFPEGEPLTLRFDAAGDKLLAGGGVPGQSGAVVVWEVSTGKRLHQVAAGYDVVLAADLSPRGDRILVGGPDRLLKLAGALSGETVQTIEKHTGWVLEADYSPEGLLFATGDRDGGIYVWEVGSGDQLHSLRGHKGAITGFAWREDGNALITASEDGYVRVWDMHSGKPITRWEAHPGGCLGVAASANHVLTIGRDNHVREWSNSGELVREHITPALPTAVASPLGDALVWGDYEGEVRLLRSNSDSQERLTYPPGQTVAPLLELVTHSEQDSPADLHPSLAESGPMAGLEDAVAQVAKRLQVIHQTHARLQDRLETLQKELAELGSDSIPVDSQTPARITAVKRQHERSSKLLQRLESVCDLLGETVKELESEPYPRADGQALDRARNALDQAVASREAIQAAVRSEVLRIEAHERSTGKLKRLQESIKILRNELEQTIGW